MRDESCPCGSGVPRADCDPDELALCLVDGCPTLFHRHGGKHRYCAEHAAKRRRASNARSAKRRRQRDRVKLRDERETAAIAAAAKRSGLPEQTTLQGTL